MTYKAVLNRCFGGFGISRKAVERMRELGSDIAKKIVLRGEKYSDDTVRSGSTEPNHYTATEHGDCFDRTDPILIQVVEELGAEANGFHAKLEVVEYDIKFEISRDYDGKEEGGFTCYEIPTMCRNS